MTEEELAAIEAVWQAATPAPWHNAHLISDGNYGYHSFLVLRMPAPDVYVDELSPSDVIAITLLQHPDVAGIVDGRAEENALAIAAAPDHVTALVAEVRRLRGLLVPLVAGEAGDRPIT